VDIKFKKMTVMITVNVKNLELNEFTGVTDKSQHCRGTFPLFGANGTKKSATVYFELQPGEQLGRHTDSAEELLYIVEGNVEVEVGGETARATSGSLALVPEMVPHNLVNSGKTVAKVLGFFGGANQIVATFEHAMLPVNSHVFDTSLMS
jgi:quercetin dioxygenase-like cupin family protein